MNLQREIIVCRLQQLSLEVVLEKDTKQTETTPATFVWRNTKLHVEKLSDYLNAANYDSNYSLKHHHSYVQAVNHLTWSVLRYNGCWPTGSRRFCNIDVCQLSSLFWLVQSTWRVTSFWPSSTTAVNSSFCRTNTVEKLEQSGWCRGPKQLSSPKTIEV